MQQKVKNKLWKYYQGRYKCLACNHRGRIPGGIGLSSVCGNCGDFMIIPERDLELVPNEEPIKPTEHK